LIDSDFGQVMRKRKTGLTVRTQEERISPDTVTYVVQQIIMLPVILENPKILYNLLNLKAISTYTSRIKIPLKNQIVTVARNITPI
jgi:hypothetical protein